MYFNELFFYMHFVLLGLLILKYLIFLIKSRILKKNKVASKKYELDILDNVVENELGIVNSYYSNTSNLVSKYFIYNKDSIKHLGISFKGENLFKNLIVYEYDKKKQLINIINLFDYDYKNKGIELTLNKDTEFINITTNDEYQVIKNKRYNIFQIIFDTIIITTITLITLNHLLNYIIGNLSTDFLNEKIKIFVFLLVVFILFNLILLTKIYFKRNKSSGRVKL